MGIVNAVLLTSKIAPRWVTDAGSISTWGRIEDTLAVGDVDDADLIDAIGAEYLAARSQPMVAHVYEVADLTGQAPVADFREGDTLAVPDLRVIDMELTVAADGRLAVDALQLNTQVEERFRRNSARIDRLIAEGGGATPVSARAAETGSTIDAGRLQPRQLTSWSWTTQEDLDNLVTADPADPETWQAYPVDEPVRLTEMVLECKRTDGDGNVVATGDTRFRLVVDGSVVVGPGPSFYDVVVTSAQDRDLVPIFGTAFVRKGQTVSVRKISDGGHVSGSVTINACEVV